MPRSLVRGVLRAVRSAHQEGRRCVVHVNGLIFPIATDMLCRAAASLCPVVLQHHGELPWSGPRGALQRFGLCRADGFLFTADSLAEPWRRSGGVRRGQPVFEVMEGWSESTRGARTWADLPATAVKYIRRIEEIIDAPIALLSTSPEREDVILVHDPFSD